jgi:hypothetical protein
VLSPMPLLPTPSVTAETAVCLSASISESPFLKAANLLIHKKASKAIRRFRYLAIPKKDREASYLVREFVRCGKPICRRKRGLRHGPYWYLRYQEWDAEIQTDRYRREYVPEQELARVRRWIRRYRVDAAFGRGLMRRYAAAVEARRRRALALASSVIPREEIHGA